MIRVMLGYDPREDIAARVAAHSLAKVSGGRLEAEMLAQPKMRDHGLFDRVEDARGQRYDFASQAPCATEFSNLRFLTPIICQSRWALFCDSDVVFYEDPSLMLSETGSGAAVYVVKHLHMPTEQYKMDGQVQTQYYRKNMSSVMLFDCWHPANRRLTLWDVNRRPGRDLHAFFWLHDSEIGALDPKWNQLVGVDEGVSREGIVHFTKGGPFTPGWHGAPYDDWWLEARAELPA